MTLGPLITAHKCGVIPNRWGVTAHWTESYSTLDGELNTPREVTAHPMGVTTHCMGQNKDRKAARR